MSQAPPNSTKPLWIDWMPTPIKIALDGRLRLQSIIANTGWLLVDRIFRMGVGLVLSVWIARYLGPQQFGILNYAISFTSIAGALAGLGIETIVVRELVKNPSGKNELLGTSFLLRLAGGFFVLLICAVAVYLNQSIDNLTRILVCIIAAGYVFQAFDTIDCWFQANVQSRYSVVAKNSAFIVLSIAKIVSLLMDASLVVFAILATMEIVVGSISMLIAYRVYGERLGHWLFKKDIAHTLIRDGWPLTLSGLAVVVYMRIDQVMLGQMMHAHAVGVYAAAVRMVEVWYFVPGIIAISVFPSIIEARKTDDGLYKKRLQQLYDITAWIGIAVAAVVTVFSKQMIGLLYGAAYEEGSVVLMIYVWSAVAVFLGIASSQFLMAENYTRISLYRTTLGMIANIALNLGLIPRYGIVGSAVATLISYSVAVFSLGFFASTREQARMMLRSLFLVSVFKTRSTGVHGG